MNEMEFYAAVAEDILDYMPERYASSIVDIQETVKNNDTSLHGLTIREKNESVVPIMYLEPFFQEYNYGKPLDEICMDIATKYDQAFQMRPSMQEPDLEYDKIQDKLRVRLVDVRNNKEFLRKMVNQPISHGFALAVYIDEPTGISTQGMINVTKEMAEKMDYDEKQLFSDAMKKTADYAEPSLQDIGEVLFGDGSQNFLKEGTPDETMQMLVLSNQHKYFGATVFFLPDMQKRIADVIGTDYYVLPSSVHELIIVPDRGEFKANDLVEMVQTVNSQMVSPEERLGNKVLFYRKDMDKLIVAADLDRDMEKERGR